MEKEYIVARRMEDGNILKINEFKKEGFRDKYNVALLVLEEGEKECPDFFKNGKEKLVFPESSYMSSKYKAWKIYLPMKSAKQFEEFVKKNQ